MRAGSASDSTEPGPANFFESCWLANRHDAGKTNQAVKRSRFSLFLQICGKIEKQYPPVFLFPMNGR